MSRITESLFVHEVRVEPAKYASLRGAVSSPIRVFHLADLGIDSEDFLNRIGPTFHDLPWDPYVPATKAENLIKKRLPREYYAREAEWLSYWNELAGLQNPLAGAEFWSQRTSSDAVRQLLNSIRAHRRRSSFQYLARPDPSADYFWNIREMGTSTFAQAVNDVRARPRRFSPSPISVYRDKDMLSFVGIVCQLVLQTASVLARTMQVTLHQMITYTDGPAGIEPAPEGPHQDGSSFIVSALVIERKNVAGGISKIYYNRPQPAAPERANDDAGLALEHELLPGFGILQSDIHNKYWHDVTPIYPVVPGQVAYRSILGLDIDFAD